jgi:hypothetical protein
MSIFLDVRISSVGGELATEVAVYQGTTLAGYGPFPLEQLLQSVQGRHVLFGTHGYNVDRAAGIACLSNWDGLLQLPSPSVFIGLLWPGDSVWLHGLEYPEEPRVADDAGALLAPFIDLNFSRAASISFISHSLGARLALSAVGQMKLAVRRMALMAGAIDDNCLTGEFAAAAGKIGTVSVLASEEDVVLSAAFPIGNFLAGVITQGHPWWRSALGRSGPVAPWPDNLRAPFEIPSNWDFGHQNYLQIDPTVPNIPPPVDVPPDGSAEPAAGATGWQEAWTAAFASTRFV